MAGDWIAFEVATLEKPEVYKLARMLGVSKADAILLLLTFWAWVDRNSADGTCHALVTQDVDQMMHCPGFASAMEAVGWLSIDDQKERIKIPGFDIHHGKSAKKRLLANRRQATHRERKRNAPSVTKASTTEQNRTEQKDQNHRVASQPLSGKPDDDLLEPSINGHDKKDETRRQMAREAVSILQFLNAKAHRNYQPVKANVDPIVGLMRQGFTPTQVRQVIAKKAREWLGDPEMDEYVRPKTLFAAKNFASYAGELVDVPDDGAAAA